MKLINLKQGTPEWLTWRKEGIGASDVPMILGKSPYKSAYDLFLEKTGKVIQKENANQAYGKAKEQEILALYTAQTGHAVTPACVESSNEFWMRASLDGADFSFSRIVEVKAASAEIFAMAKKGVLPAHYMLQVQAQLYCIQPKTPASDQASVKGASVCDYVAYHKGEIAIVTVERDAGFDKNIPALKEFLERTRAGIEPPISEGDCVLIEDDLAFELAAKNYWELKESFDAVKEEFEQAKAMLCAFGDGLSVRGYQTKINVAFKKGNIDYTKVPELKGVNLEPYRKPAYKETRIYKMEIWSRISNSNFNLDF